MLRQRRNNNLLAESLGPPVRLLCTENGEKVDDKSAQRSTLSRKPPLSASSLARAAGKENRYQCGTPRETPAPCNNRQTPNSTYPNSMRSNSSAIKSVNLVAGQRTPSSTFPVSLPITDAPNTQQDTGITEPDSFPAPEPTHKAECTSPNEEPGTEEIKTDRISKVIDVDVSLRRGSDDRGIPTQATGTTTTTTTAAAATTNPPPPSLSSAPPPPPPSQPSATPASTVSLHGQPLSQQGPAVATSVGVGGDVVTMASNAGQMRFKRLKLLGCGGSSKVRDYTTMCSLMP